VTTIASTIASTATRLIHRVRLVHAGTGTTIQPVKASMPAIPYGWSFRESAGEVIVIARDGVDVPAAPPVVDLIITDGKVLSMLTLPPLVDGQPLNSVRVTLSAPDITQPVTPVPTRLTVHLSTTGSGAPRTGQTVRARASSGPNPKPTVNLPEVSPGVYQSAPTVWAAVFYPVDLLVGGDPLRTIAMDVTRTETRIHLVDTT